MHLCNSLPESKIMREISSTIFSLFGFLNFPKKLVTTLNLNLPRIKAPTLGYRMVPWNLKKRGTAVFKIESKVDPFQICHRNGFVETGKMRPKLMFWYINRWEMTRGIWICPPFYNSLRNSKIMREIRIRMIIDWELFSFLNFPKKLVHYFELWPTRN